VSDRRTLLGGPAGGSSVALTPTAVKTGAYTAAAGDLVPANVTSAGFTVTLPTSPAVGAVVGVYKTDASGNTLTIAPAGGGTIDGDPNATTTTKNAGATFEHLGSNAWKVVASYLTTGPQGPTGATGPAGPTGPTGPAGSLSTVQDEGSALTQRTALNFIGSAVTAADDAANNRTNVTISAPSVIPRGRPVEGGTTRYTIPGSPIVSHSAQTMSAGRILYEPLFLATDVTIDQLAIRVNSAVAASTARVAIFSADTSWQPSALVVEPTVSTQLDTSATGTKTTSLTQALPAGRYLKALICSAGIQVDCAFCASEFGGFDDVNGPIGSWYVGSTYGAFSATVVPWTSHTVSNSGFQHAVFVRVSVP
jgi:hypothetical protein